MDINKKISGGITMKRKVLAMLFVVSMVVGLFSGCANEVEMAQGVTETTVKVGNSIAA